MARLTDRDEYGNANIIALEDTMPEIYAELSFSETNALTAALNKLADYEDADEWIDVKDRLPEKSSTVVLGVPTPGTMPIGQNVVMCEYIKPSDEECGFFRIYPHTGMFDLVNLIRPTIKFDLIKITHWRPLPEPPNIGKEATP